MTPPEPVDGLSAFLQALSSWHPDGVAATFTTRRLSGTDSYELETMATSPLVRIARTIGVERSLLGMVLPGGKLVQPVAEFVDGALVPVRRALAGRAEVHELSALCEKHALALPQLLGYLRALRSNVAEAARIRRRADADQSVLKPCLDLYDTWVKNHPSESRLSQLTEHLLGARTQTEAIVQTRATARHADRPEQAMSVINSMRRSAGTNYQSLVALALAEELIDRQSCWYVAFPPPADYANKLALRFRPKPGFDVEIDPDIDILLRNATYSTGDEPIVLLSIKTSLADRVGSAARWKMYFDVATHDCPFEESLAGCAWHDQGLRFAKPDLHVRLAHCIATANIYKVGSDDKFADEGELGTAQTKANTFMFDKRYATRTGPNVYMEGWEPLTEVTLLLDSLAQEKALAP